MKKKYIIWSIVVVVLLVSGVLVIRKAKKRDASSQIPKIYPMVVNTIQPKMKQDTLSLPYLAVVNNAEDVMLSSKIAARIDYLVASGAKVAKGQVIARLDATSIESGIESVKAQLAAANTSLKNLKASHQRTLELVAVKGASAEQSEMEENKIAQTESTIETLRQKLNDLNNNLSYATIKSPTSGIISKTMANVGDLSSPGHPLALINSTSGSFLEIRVPADLKVYSVKLGGQTYEAISLNSTFNGLAEYKVASPNSALKTGERVEVSIEVFAGKAVILPFDAVLNREGKSYVFVREGDKARAQAINIIQSGEEGIAVDNPELAGKEIVVEKPDVLLKLLSGSSVKVKGE